MRLNDYCAANGLTYDQAAMDDIFRQTRDAAYQIIERKGATYYAVAAGLMRVVEATLRDQSTVLSVSSLVGDYLDLDGVCLSLPTVVNRAGVERVLRLKLDHQEVEGLRRSADILRATLVQLELEGP